MNPRSRRIQASTPCFLASRANLTGSSAHNEVHGILAARHAHVLQVGPGKPLSFKLKRPAEADDRLSGSGSLKFGFAAPGALGSRGVRLAPDHGRALARIVAKASPPPGAGRAGHRQVVPGALASGMPLADRSGCPPHPPLQGPRIAANRAPCSVIDVGRQAAPPLFVGRCRIPWIDERPGLEGVARVSGIATANLQRIISGRAHRQCRARP